MPTKNATQLLPGKPKLASSTRDMLVSLPVGDSYALVKKIILDEATSNLIAEEKEKLHNAARSAISRASAATGHTYASDTGDFSTTHGHNTILCFVITRTA